MRVFALTGASAGRLEPLDGVRGLAAAGVALFWHYQHFQPAVAPFAEKAYWLHHYGARLVDLFFVLSGVVFAYVYRDRLRDRAISLREYVVLRFSRLYPLHVITLVAVAVLQVVRLQQGQPFFVYTANDVRTFVLNVLFLQKGWVDVPYSFNAPSWSVSVEIMAYLVFFAALVAVGRRVSNVVVFALLAIVGLTLVTSPPWGPFNGLTGRVILGFFVGCLLFDLHERAARAGRSGVLGAAAATVLLVVGAIGVLVGHEAFGDPYLVYVLVIFPAVVLVSLNVAPVRWVLSLRPFVYLGVLSYSLYMLHFPVQLAIVTTQSALGLEIDFAARRAWLVYTLLCLVAAAASYHLVELPLQRRIRARASRPRATEHPPVGPTPRSDTAAPLREAPVPAGSGLPTRRE
ncbi:acyltransferase 3 [Cellulomonas flavigena DSM 20109]|uniref:Acyltransferase 3 n=1 Tax=Cellulomonas flavigena (strain ATCC 482 / DSM 20109 / BCRC 11376 / JCM 18109 / NBRC 3775 / NCIMB 8073 / NRS 134) TaxID=446466 RepID=D5UFD0_CELFN|nr:acyltransferase [Cellulomonas flavigena]ADG74927.1 acyltransferase 3 [Cellulomonas flavigena DSM 20109]